MLTISVLNPNSSSRVTQKIKDSFRNFKHNTNYKILCNKLDKAPIGIETDDVVATLWKRVSDERGVDSVVIASLDKDYKQFPCWFYDYHYKKKTLTKISEEEATVNFYTQMIVGDSADNIKYCKGYGKVYAGKLLNDVKTPFSATRRVYTLFKDVYGDEAKDKYNECKTLLTLKTDCDDGIRIQKA